MTCGYLCDDIYFEHDPGEGHPESPERLAALHTAVQNAEWYDKLVLLGHHPVDVETLALVHEPAYIELVRRECEAGRGCLSTGDAAICKKSYDVARHAVGGVLDAVDAVFEKRIDRAFCAVRPPAHHASADKGMGFCLFNSIAVAARYAQKKYHIERVLIADWDIHHGNGTQDIFYSDGSVFVMSTHQFPGYPGTGLYEQTGEGKGKGTTMNRPLFVGAGNKELIYAFSKELLPAARDFKPELTLISAGFDSRVNDPLGGFRVDDTGFRELTKIMLEISYIAGEGRLVSVLEGGYNFIGLAAATLSHMDELIR
ncbi:MAG: histone deacetylase [Candidatus Omnitrophota bacterium]